MNRSVLLYTIVPVIVAVLLFGALRIFFHITYTRSVTTDVVQGILVGAALAFVSVLLILPKFYVTKVNGWTTMCGCGEPGSGLLLRAACNVTFMGPINVSQEAMYWTTSKDGAGHTLSGAHDYMLHFTGDPRRNRCPKPPGCWNRRALAGHDLPSTHRRFSIQGPKPAATERGRPHA